MLELGKFCPAGIFEEFEVPRTRLPALPGQPVVVGLAESWAELGEAELERLQAQLEPLGAALVLISSRELVCVRPKEMGDSIVRSSRVRRLWPSGLGPWHRAPAVNAASSPGCVNTRRSGLTLALIDEQGIVRWLQRSTQSAETLELLQVALAQTRRQLRQRLRLASGAGAPASLGFSRAELAASLLSAFTGTFGAGAVEPAPLQARTVLPATFSGTLPHAIRH